MLHGQTRYNVPSRFLQEIPDNLLKWLQPVQKTGYRNQATESRNREPNVAIREPAFGMQDHSTSVRDAEAAQWRVGQNVTHAKFGAGVIVSCESQGADARVQVKFSHAGTKWLSLEYAKLIPA
jgi:DNA helicase-2/ATP-dependent DNA helicase PcrA